MSTTIDSKVVYLKFDNKAFEAKMAETLRSLDKLKQSLDFRAARNNMADLSGAAKKFDMSQMGVSIDGISNKFLALSTIAITALSRITDKAIDVGSRIVKAFSFGPIIQGFQEYETNMNSIQTILANTKSKGSTLEDVNNALEELNVYADQTIYNFSEMARNIGTFTAAGVDLEPATAAIKGIANLAAISGSSATQASTAMYQLSQALAAGRVNLMDWRSVENAGLGGEIFRKSLFETGKALGTITNVPLTATYEEWEKKGGKFRDQMQSGWLTADVLSTSLQAFSGDLDEAQLKSLGFSEAQAKQMVELGELGKASATEVKTFTQLISTVKEAIGSGWAQSFKIMIGDFEEAKKLFTDISNAIGGWVEKSAQARNEMLGGWKAFGGRELLLEGLTNALKGIASVLKPIQEAFREIFPKKTAGDLVKMTIYFTAFTQKLKIGEETADKIKRAFVGFFSIFKIFGSVIKAAFGLFTNFLGKLTPAGSGFLDIAASAGDMVARFAEIISEGDKLKEFFEKLVDIITHPIEFITNFREKMSELFGVFDQADKADGAISRIDQRFSRMGETASKVSTIFSILWDVIKDFGKVVAKIFGEIGDLFSGLWDELKDALKPGDFDTAVDAVNVGLLGGILLALRKFLKDGLDLNVGGGILDKIGDLFDELTNTLKAMQTQLKSKTLLNIALAVGALTASILVLSLIDSGALTKSLTAMGAGFGQLIGAMIILDHAIGYGFNTAKIATVAVAMIALSIAVGILGIAVKQISKLSWEELLRGLVGVTVMLIGLTKATTLIASDTKGLIKAGISMIAISLALILMATAVKSFAKIQWDEMGRGMAGVAGGLLLLVLAVNAMPEKSMLRSSFSLIAMSISLIILAKAVSAFSGMKWEEMGRGLTGVAASLLIIAGAMHLMPSNMILTSVGLIILSVALGKMAEAIKTLGALGVDQLAKGIGSLAIMLGILVLATNAMSSAILGAVSMIIVAKALEILAEVIKTIGKLKIAQIAAGLITIALAIGILALTAALISPLTFALLGLGAAMFVIGAGFALFGLGVSKIADGLATLGSASKETVDNIVEILKGIAKAIPDILTELAKSLIEMGKSILEAVPAFLEAAKIIIGALLDAIIELSPKIRDALFQLIGDLLGLLKDLAPKFVEAGFGILLSFLTGLRANIEEIATLVIEIIGKFVETVEQNMPYIVESAVNLITSFLTELGNHAEELVDAGVAVLVSFLDGLSNNIDEIIEAVSRLVGNIILGLGGLAEDFVTAGTDALVSFLEGFGENVEEIIKGVGTMVTGIVTELGNQGYQFAIAGGAAIAKFVDGIGDAIDLVCDAAHRVIGKFVKCVTGLGFLIVGLGVGIIAGIIAGIGSVIGNIAKEGWKIVSGFIGGVTSKFGDLVGMGTQLFNKAKDAISGAISAGWNKLKSIGGSIVRGITEGLTGNFALIDTAATAAAAIAESSAKKRAEINSPSKVFMRIGGYMIEGMANGLSDTRKVEAAGENAALASISSLTEALKRIEDYTNGLIDINPVITPVLDLSGVAKDAKTLTTLFDQVPSISADVSYSTARDIAYTTDTSGDNEDSGPSVINYEIKFEQINNSPKALSTSDIYRNTKSQLATAKEELGI